MDIAATKAAVEHDVSGRFIAIGNAPAAVRADAGFGLWAVTKNGAHITYLAEALRDDEAIANAAIRSWAPALQFVSARLQGVKSVVEPAVCSSSGCGLLRFASAALRADAALVERSICGSLSMANMEFASAAVRSDGALFLRLEQHVVDNPEGTAGFGEPQLFGAASAALLDDDDFALAAIKLSPTVFPFFSERVRAIRVTALAAVSRCGNLLQHAAKDLRADAALVLVAAQHSSGHDFSRPEWRGVLQVAAPELRADHDIVLAAVRSNGAEFAHAAPAMHNDRAVLLAALAGGAPLPAGSALCADKAIVLSAVRLRGANLRVAADALRGDREVVLAATAQDPNSFEFASEALRDDRELVLALARKDGSYARCASARLLGDPEIAALISAADAAHAYAAR